MRGGAAAVRSRESLIRELKTRIKSAEREGRIGEAMELAEELSDLR